MSSPIQNLDHLKIPLKDILEATNHFSNENFIRQGGFGKIYKGTLLRSGEMIDIVARRLDTSYGQGSKEFWTEVSMLSSLKHENLVSIVGFCDEKNEKIVINKYEAKGSLDNYLSDPSLTWLQRLKICVGVARALNYIHYDEERDFSVIHRNIKSSKILLDDKWEPKLSGFELSVTNIASRRHRLCLTEPCGTIGYVDPTYVKTGCVSHKSDIYSFGVVLLEVLFGRQAIINKRDTKFAQLAKTHYEYGQLDDMIDPHLRRQMDQKSFNFFAEEAYDCLKKQRAERRNIDQIIVVLEKAYELQCKHENLVRPLTANASDRWKENKDNFKISLDEIKLATRNFSNLIGKGGFGQVYKGEVTHAIGRNIIVAKRLDGKSGEGETQLMTELEILLEYKHENLIGLVGYCDEEGEKIIVYEYASRGSLDRWLKHNDLTWRRRLAICIDIASGLDFLHGTSHLKEEVVIHRDIKAANILLHGDWKAKIADFGLSLISPINQEMDYVIDNAKGTSGYCDPQYITTSMLTKESDIYSFGVLLFEILCGRFVMEYDNSNARNLVHEVRRYYVEGRLDEMVFEAIKKQIVHESLTTYIDIAYECTHEEIESRPTARKVLIQLTKALEFQNHGAASTIPIQSYHDQTLKKFRIPLEEIRLAIGVKSTETQIGDGGFGLVYKGKLSELWQNRTAAIKYHDPKGYQGKDEFRNELKMISMFDHENIIPFIGYCDEGNEMIIVSEYATNGSLDQYLRNLEKRRSLTWVQRLKICLGAAKGINYLHSGLGDYNRVVHRDVKSANILLDDNLKAKICDFGLSRSGPRNQPQTQLYTQAAGTKFYIDPIYHESGILRKESDVYSFGVVLFEVLSGMLAYDRRRIGDDKPQHLINLVRRYYEEGLDKLIDHLIKDQIDRRSFDTFVEIAHECISYNLNKRPTMQNLVERIEDALAYQVAKDSEMKEPEGKITEN